MPEPNPAPPLFERLALIGVGLIVSSVARIAQRQQGRSPPVPVDWAVANLGHKPKAAPFPAEAVLQALEHTTIPVPKVYTAFDRMAGFTSLWRGCAASRWWTNGPGSRTRPRREFAHSSGPWYSS